MKPSIIKFVFFIGLFDIALVLSAESDKNVLSNISKDEESIQPGFVYDFSEDIFPNRTLDYGLDLRRQTYTTVCDLVESAVRNAAYKGGSNEHVANMIGKELLDQRVGSERGRGRTFFVIVYDPVYGATNHWGHNYCGQFYRIPVGNPCRNCIKAYNVRVLLGGPMGKKCGDYSFGGCIIRICKGCHWAAVKYKISVTYFLDPGLNQYIFAVS